MKRFVQTSFAVVALALSSIANAGVITTTYQAQGASHTIDANSPFTVNFDLTQAPYNYRTSFDTVTSAELVFSFKDTGADNRRNPNNEDFAIRIGSDLIGSSGGIINIPNSGRDYGPFIIQGGLLDALSASGKLSLVISATSGSFRFVSSRLTANVELGDEVLPPGPVPEPLSVALLGIGLAGIAAARRKA